jgi:Na+/proline symporter
MYTAGALGCVAAGIYWRRANSVGAYCALTMGALAPAGFLILEKWRDSLPSSLSFVSDVNVSGLLSFVLAFAGMIIGSLATQKICPPVRLNSNETTEARHETTEAVAVSANVGETL